MSKFISWSQYQQASKRTTAKTDNPQGYCLGLIGETGEIVDIIKKVVYHQHPVDFDHLIEETGDLCWYLSQIASTSQIKLPLDKRYQIFLPETDLTNLGIQLAKAAADLAQTVNLSYLHSAKAPAKFDKELLPSFRRASQQKFDRNKNNISQGLALVLALLQQTLSNQEYWESHLTLPQILDANLTKLKERYPHGFTIQDSINRIDHHKE